MRGWGGGWGGKIGIRWKSGRLMLRHFEVPGSAQGALGFPGRTPQDPHPGLPGDC